MTTRTAEEADIAIDDEQRESTRVRTDEPAPPEPPDANANTTAKKLDVLTYLRLPEFSAIHIHGWDAITKIENQDPGQVAMWDDDPGAKLLVYKAYGGRIDSVDEITRLQEIIGDAINATTPLSVAPPIPVNAVTKKEGAPLCSLVSNILPEKAQELIERRFISTPDLTVLFIPYAPPPFCFVTTLKGFLFPKLTDSQSETAVLEIVGEALFSTTKSSATSMEIRRFLAKHRDNISGLIKDIETALAYLRSSIKVRRYNLVEKINIGTGEGKSTPVWNIYIYPPTGDNAALIKWRSTIRGFTFITKDQGAGRSLKIYKCTVCFSIDHPTGLCPYPQLQKWITPKPDTSPALEDLLNSSHPNGINRGTSSRGSHRGHSRNTRGRPGTAHGPRNPARG
jgi:hypothetical protein